MEAEVIDLRTISPIDMDTILESVKKTNRAVVSTGSTESSRYCSNVVSAITDEAILHLEAPVLRVTAPDTVFPICRSRRCMAA
ncbi:transketolase C-terminal domain-containing protein [Sinobaca sp. H24]|uniref:transketolase C-terminal domain-containing protein n=1 Tax=Sinobaca sp. H24 TaxID=2923376 RepID=UPI0035B47EDE